MAADEQMATTEEQETAEQKGLNLDRLNDRSAYQACFGCGARNDAGLQLSFRLEGDEIVTEYTPERRFQGFPNVLHGGVIATLLDETLSRTATLGGRWMMTARLDIRYRRAALLGQTLRITARAISIRSRAVTAKGEVRLADDPSVIIAEAEGTFLAITPQYQQEMVASYPELASFFDQ